MFRILGWMAIGVFASACVKSYRGSVPQAQSAAENVVQLQARVSWGMNFGESVERRFISQDGYRFLVNSPVTLPSDVPERIRLDIGFASDWLDKKIRVSAAGKAEEIERTSSSFFSFDLEGIRSLLKGDEGQIQLTLKVEDARSSQVLSTLEVELRTLPSQLIIKDVKDVKDAIGNLSDRQKRIASSASRLDLLKVIHVQNPSKSALRVTFQMNPRGGLRAKSIRKTLNQKWCSYTVVTTILDEVLSEDVVVMPVDPSDLNNDPIFFLDSHLPSGKFDLVFQGEEEKQIGIYGRGAGVVKFIEGEYGPQRFQPVVAVDRCTSTCGVKTAPGIWGDYNKKVAASYWRERDFPGASSACARAFCGWVHVEPQTSDLCNECAEWELHNGTQPWDQARFCQSSTPGNPWGHPAKEHWVVEKHRVMVEAGTQSLPPELVIHPDDLEAEVRYWHPPGVPGVDDPVSRGVRVLSALFEL